MTTNQHIITALAAMAVLTMLSPSCGKTETENAYSQQDKNIESIVSSLAPEGSGATVEYFDGSVRVTVKQGEGEALEDNGSVSFYYAGHCVKSSSLSSGNMFVTARRSPNRRNGLSRTPPCSRSARSIFPGTNS